jgi:acetylornithine deacetylase/succinyl-diaminopimelate desuccinylase-like protein
MTRTQTLLALSAFIASTASAQTATLTPHQRLAHDVYKQLVEINTVDSVGSVTKAAEAMAARFRAAGFPERDIQLLVPPGKPTKGNLVVRYHGTGTSGRKPILLLAHLDVVAAKREDWPRDPFTLYEENGFFLGRGTSDDKSMAAAFVANMLRLKAEKFVPDRDIILALTADEEGGDANGAKWLANEHKDLIDAAYALNEGGSGTLNADDKPIFNEIQATEKVYHDFTLTTTNTGGHSSVPRPDNAIYQLSQALLNISRYQFPVALNDITRGFFTQAAKVESRPELAAAMRAIVANPNDATANVTLSSDPRYNSTLRTTCVATRLNGGHAYNALPQSATANVNCRMAPTTNVAEVQKALERAINDTGVKVTWTLKDAPKFGRSVTPIDPQLLGAATELTKKMWGDIPVIPVMSTGATDGAHLRAVGIPTYGVKGMFSRNGETNAHGRDEKMRVKSFYEGVEFLDQLVRQVSASPRP